MAKNWYVYIMGVVIGPMESAVLGQMARNMRITPDDEVREGIDGNWVSADKVNGLFSSTKKPSPTIPEIVRRTAAKLARLKRRQDG